MLEYGPTDNSAVSVLLSRRVHDPLPPDPTRSFDTGGAILSAVGLILVVTGVLAADNNLWLMLALLAAGALVLVWFFASMRGKERAGKEPLLSTSLFRNRISNLGLVTQGSQWLILMGVSFVVSGYLQVVVLTQYKSHSLDRHVTQTWRMSTMLGNYVAPIPAQQRVDEDGVRAERVRRLLALAAGPQRRLRGLPRREPAEVPRCRVEAARGDAHVSEVAAHVGEGETHHPARVRARARPERPDFVFDEAARFMKVKAVWQFFEAERDGNAIHPSSFNISRTDHESHAIWCVTIRTCDSLLATM